MTEKDSRNRKPRAARPWASWHNVTVSLEQSDFALLKGLCGRYGQRSYSHALRCAIREVAGVDPKAEETEENEGQNDTFR